jgi:hypothetical protein
MLATTRRRRPCVRNKASWNENKPFPRLEARPHWNYVSSDKNRNVWAVLSYLTGFLNHIGVPTDALASPPT